jgi:hypothetical protein
MGNAGEQASDVPETTLDEINAEIAAAGADGPSGHASEITEAE